MYYILMLVSIFCALFAGYALAEMNRMGKAKSQADSFLFWSPIHILVISQLLMAQFR